SFRAAIKCSHAARDYSLHKLTWRAKRRWNFARIKNANAPAAPGTNVEQPAAISQRFGHDFNGHGQLGSRGAQCRLDELLFLDKNLDQLSSAHFFQILRARVALLGQSGSQTVDFGLR